MPQLRWQCRRGMRELDDLLLSYLENVYPLASDADKAEFQSLLTLPDPELMGYLLGQHEPPAEMAIVIQRIRDRTKH